MKYVLDRSTKVINIGLTTFPIGHLNSASVCSHHSSALTVVRLLEEAVMRPCISMTWTDACDRRALRHMMTTSMPCVS